MADRPSRHPLTASLEHRAESLKERVYVSFTSLSVALTLRTHADETTPGEAAVTLIITVVGTLLAVFVADLLSHLTVHAKVPTRTELRQMVAVSLGAGGVLIAPLIFLGLASAGVWSTGTALTSAVAILVATLALVGYLAIRRVALPIGQKFVILLAEVALSLVVIGLQVVAHGG